jgi:hypothetical protein
MTYIEGVPFTKLVIPTGFSKKLFASQGRKMLNILADAWGHMLFDAGVFNAVSMIIATLNSLTLHFLLLVTVGCDSVVSHCALAQLC